MPPRRELVAGRSEGIDVLQPETARPFSIRLTVPGGTPNIAGIWLLVNRSAAQHHQYAAIDGSVDWSRRPRLETGAKRRNTSETTFNQRRVDANEVGIGSGAAEDYRSIPERLASGKSMKKRQLPPEPRWLAAWPIV